MFLLRSLFHNKSMQDLKFLIHPV